MSPPVQNGSPDRGPGMDTKPNLPSIPCLKDLLERVEGASGGDRELDYLLWCALFPDHEAMIDTGEMAIPGRRAGRPARMAPLREWPEAWKDSTDHEALAMVVGATTVTASIDAALGLVERVYPGAWWSAGDLAPTPGRGPFEAKIGHRDISEWPRAFAKTAPLAICASLLRALIASADTPGGGDE